MSSFASTSSFANSESPFRGHLRFSVSVGVQELQSKLHSSVLGALWLFLAPVLLMLVYWVVFDLVVGIEFRNPASGQSVPFLAAFSVGLFLYLSLSELLSSGASWFKNKRKLLKESALPAWAIFNILATRVGIQYFFYIAVAIGIASFYGVCSPDSALLYALYSIPVYILFVGIALIVSLLGAFFGDIRELIPVLMRVAFYTSSITFPLNMIPDKLRWLTDCNPLTWTVEIVRSALIWQQALEPGFVIGVSAAMLLVWGIAAFMYWRLAGLLDQVV